MSAALEYRFGSARFLGSRPASPSSDREIGGAQFGDGRSDAARLIEKVHPGLGDERARGAAAGAHVVPEPLTAGAERRHDADPTDRDAHPVVDYGDNRPAMLSGTIVWLGGAAFVASLSFCGWTYLVGWSSPASVEMSWRAIALDAILVTLFASHHSLFARDRVKAWVSRAVPEALVRSLYVWVASGLLVAMLWLWQPVGGELYRLHGWFGWAGVALQLTGLWLIVQAVRAIDALELAGIRQVTRPAPSAPLRSLPRLPS